MTRSFFLSLARTAIAAALLVGALLPSGCTTTSSPTLPIPPPEALSSAPDAEGFVTIEGDGAIEGAQVLADVCSCMVWYLGNNRQVWTECNEPSPAPRWHMSP